MQIYKKRYIKAITLRYISFCKCFLQTTVHSLSGKEPFLSVLPNHHPVSRQHIHRFAFFDIECGVESIDIAEGGIDTPLA